MYYYIVILSLLCVSFFSFSDQRQFEQAYAPISVGQITIFIPVDYDIFPPKNLVVKESGSNYLIEWTGVPGANYYDIEQIINGKWVRVGSDIKALSFTVKKGHSANFRVSACNQFGCSTRPAHQNSLVVDDLEIKRFTASSYKVDQNTLTQLSWEVENASNVVIRSSEGKTFEQLALRGKIHVYPSNLETFTITASGFGQSLSDSLMVVVNIPREIIETTLTPYIEPLRGKGFDVIERSLLPLPSGVMFSTHDERVVMVNRSADVLWKYEMKGVVANKGKFVPELGSVFVSVSKLDGTGEICALDVTGMKEHICKNTVHSSISSPVVIDLPPSSEGEAPKKLIAVVDMKGKLYLKDPRTLESMYKVVDIPPELISEHITANIAVEPNSSNLILRVSPDRYVSISILEQSKGCRDLSSCTRSFMSLFSSSSNVQEQQEPTINIEVNWVKEHKE
ncbi:fibronectin type III domain-containing protein [Pseudoalteromonas luteoviolacea]|uniref:Fibronectin type-III domain-containing protein n=1 Tax=Pseudoalteromonas luteoviolacea H33 TaxID=1365251 RepID=A0A167EJJ1_9GAMM|nr:fibronectin type III domain-containing protein [Pseudoalteromonas luteoviolacea]KZN50857.1 hypothetical protein N476_14545 [Pseudoalteromonas luteoviolacea H33]KZN75553.1 hypothetical protein N477_18585 [Pseudoalteromonas luteoviolacea H33-S]MBQ4880388.1 fibronectin type III domain-containing protein [Pseudoalteromonas luteoviolacea]MBQ4909464.1 fibronectin type III domain-containing protein [Pseudoalteromonas luteoviolacea]